MLQSLKESIHFILTKCILYCLSQYSFVFENCWIRVGTVDETPCIQMYAFPTYHSNTTPIFCYSVKLGTISSNSCNIYISCVFEHDTYCHLHTHEASSCIPKSKIFRCIVWVLITKEGGSSAPTHWNSDAIRSSEHKLKYFIRREWWAAICNGEWNVITNNISTRRGFVAKNEFNTI